MKSREIFSLMVRFFGLIFLFQGLVAVPGAWTNFCPVFPHFQFRMLFSSVLVVGWPVAVGVWMVRGAPWLVRLAFAREREHEDSRP